ncbi:MAG: hypothetical protein AW12_01863 [Candidatus Accumulibacter sp. BA-94]|nr:MAG: hypothetical protein AW12_01863 [Candidatus Accumulibacter sp. BA-94]
MQGSRRLIAVDRQALGKQHRPAVESSVHLHDAHASFRVASENRPLYWCGATPAWQQRAMDIDAAETRHVEHSLRQNQAIGGDHHRLRANSANPLLHRSILKRWRLQDFDTGPHRQQLDRRLAKRHAPPSSAVWLSQHQRYLVPGGNDRLQRKRGELRSARENQLHAVILACLASLFLIRTCLSCDRCSTNTRPSRWSISCCRHTASKPTASTLRCAPSRSR